MCPQVDEAADPDDDVKSSNMAAAARAGGVFARLGPALEQMQKFVAKAALLLWLWFDQQCEVMAEEVSAGPTRQSSVVTAGVCALPLRKHHAQQLECSKPPPPHVMLHFSCWHGATQNSGVDAA